MTIGVAVADHNLGPYREASDDPVFPPGTFHIEDPFIWASVRGYELIAKDMDGTLCGEKYGGVHAYSADGVKWRLAERPLAYSRRIVWDDGTTQNVGNLERPFLLFHDGAPTHLFVAVSDGKDGFESARNTWNMVFPLSP